jgi:hypothetical protein
MHHPEVTGKLVRNGRQLACQGGVAGVDAHAHIDRFHGAQNPKDVLGMAGKKVRQHVDEMDPEFAAPARGAGQHDCGILHAPQPLMFGKISLLGSRMNHEVLHAQGSGRAGPAPCRDSPNAWGRSY